MSPEQRLSLRLERTFDAPAAAVFDAWTSPEVMRRWWHPYPSWETPTVEVDVRVGGAIRIVMRDPAAGAEHGASGEYTEVDRPRRLAYSWSWDRWPDEPPMMIEVDFAERDGRTTVTLTNTGLPNEEERAGHEEGWAGTLDNLEGVLPAG